jgi:hypothetical protein
MSRPDTAPSLAALCRPLLWIPLLITTITAQMPYNPTRLLYNGSLVYVFQPSADSSTQFELGTIDISSSNIAASKLPYTQLYPTLPFLDSKKAQPFDAVLDNGGNITVYTGDCALGASGGQIWSFAPEPAEKSGKGSWTQDDLAFAQQGKYASRTGPNYLSAGMSFSAMVNGNVMSTEAYFFGGMCPFQNEDSNEWQSSANYSNLMVTLEPSRMDAESVSYQLDVSSSRGPPIAEAGFTLTGLSPLFSNQSDGTQTQQQNFVLIAGHTSSAFINTSQVALFSLPQQGWTFIPVSQPDTSRTDLAIRTDVGEIEPRSGHSAVLTADGTRVIIFGGWIGDTNTPAEPQLAVLNIGDGYGGQGEWKWAVPTTTGSGLPAGSGIYGHGAAMLPGGVMMVMGGYSMSAPNSRRGRTLAKRNSENTQNMFFNVSSNTWITDYSPPADVKLSQSTQDEALSTHQKAGLGAGLGVGMAAVLGLMAFYIWYTRRLKKHRDLREKQLQELARGAHRYNVDVMSPGVDGLGGQAAFSDANAESYFYPSTGPQQGQGWKRTNSGDAERTGLLVEIPSPTRGLRRSLSGRPMQPMARYDERRVRGSGHIHPIDELDEEQEHDGTSNRAPLTAQPEMTEKTNKQSVSIFDNAPVLDPFTDSSRTGHERKPVLHSAPTSPIREDDNDQDWHLAAGPILPRHSTPSPEGRVSPTKSSDRTGSNLSERSTRSNLSVRSTNGSLGRSASMRSAAILHGTANPNPFKNPESNPTVDAAHRNGSGWNTPIDPRTHSFTSIRSNGRPGTANADAESFTTARSSFMALQAEGEALLGGNPEKARPDTSSTSDGSNGYSSQNTASSLNRANTITAATSVVEGFTRAGLGRERRKSWLGSVRKALGRTTTPSDRTRSLTTATMQLEPYTDDPKAPGDSIARDKRMSLPASAPRRAASDASFWNSKRGKQDWIDDDFDVNDPQAKWRRVSGDDWGAPEDVALAEKERLRREWRERGNLLINLADGDQIPTPHTPIHSRELGVPNTHDRPRTPADEDDWDVEAAVERRVVQVMFTVPKSKLRVVNADVDRSSLLSLPRENSKDSIDNVENSGSPGSSTPHRVKDLAGKFEQMNTPRMSPRASPRPSPSPSIKSLKVRGKKSSASLTTPRKSSSRSVASRGKERSFDEM